jgi:phytoene/squalene synthetase
MALEAELRRIAEAADGYAAEGEELAGIVPAEPRSDVRVYVCAFRDGEETSWLVLDARGSAVEDRAVVRDSVSIAGLVELAEEAAGAEAPAEPRVATAAELDGLGAAADDRQGFAAVMQHATATVEELVRDVERGYKRPLR